MPIELYFSNQLDQLAEKFANTTILECQNRSNILAPTTVVVPNANLAKWLQLFLARERSIAMNVDFQYLEAGLWEMLAAVDPAGDKENSPERLDTDKLKILLLHTLGHLPPDDAEFAPLTQYLYEGDGTVRADAPARLWQLSEKLGHLFEEYEFHRTEMIEGWQTTAAPPLEMEACQRRLYLRLKELRNRVIGQKEGRQSRGLLSTLEYADQVLDALERGKKPPPDRTESIHFFGLSQISNFHLNLIGRLQPYYQIHIYTMNPCEEFWEDIRTPAEKRWLQRKGFDTLAIEAAEQDQGELFRTADNALLAAWGKPGRESVRLLCRLTDYDFNACFTTARPGGGVLQRVQNDILTLSTSDDGLTRTNQDRTLQIVACPSRYREVETVFNSILHNLQQDDGLQLTDIAILVPDMSAYKPVIDSVFNRRPARLSYNLVDSRAEIESVYGKAVLALLKLAGSRFTRTEVFDLLLNPCFMQQAGITSEQVKTWANWTRELNIFHTYDNTERVRRGYPDSDRFTWQQGLERLRLARIMAPPEDSGMSEYGHYRQRTPYADVESSDQELVEQFCLIIEDLHRAVNALGTGARDGRQWKEDFFHICDRLFAIPDTYRGEAVVRQTLFNTFDRLALYDRLPTPENGKPFALTIDIIREFINANLTAISGGHGNYLTGGVTISALQPMRPIPFRIVYVLGLEEGRFPGKTNPSTLDLRLAKRRIGDITLPERNRYLFLEMFLSVREKLYLSYVARDLQRDRMQQPCNVVNQLKRYMEEHVLPPEQPFQIQQIPLAGSSGRYLSGDALQPWSDVLVNGTLSDRVIRMRSQGLWTDFQERASVQDMDRTARFDPDLTITSEDEAGRERPKQTVTIEQLDAFLKDPVKAQNHRHLGLFGEAETIEETVGQEDEPVFSRFPVDYNLAMEAARVLIVNGLAAPSAWVIDGSTDPQKVFNLVYETAHRQSRTPDGAYADIDRNHLAAGFEDMAAQLLPVIDRMARAKEVLLSAAIGDPADLLSMVDSGLEVKRFDPPAFTVDTRDCNAEEVAIDVSLHGQCPWLWKDTQGRRHMLIVTGAGMKSSSEIDKYVLKPVLFYMFCLAGDDSSQLFDETGLTLHFVYKDSTVTRRYVIDKKTAAAYLKELVTDYLDQSLSAWLPFDAVTAKKHPDRPHMMAIEDADAHQKEAYALALEEKMAEVDDYLIHLVRPVVPEDAFDRVHRRFKLFVPQESV